MTYTPEQQEALRNLAAASAECSHLEIPWGKAYASFNEGYGNTDKQIGRPSAVSTTQPKSDEEILIAFHDRQKKKKLQQQKNREYFYAVIPKIRAMTVGQLRLDGFMFSVILPLVSHLPDSAVIGEHVSESQFREVLDSKLG